MQPIAPVLLAPLDRLRNDGRLFHSLQSFPLAPLSETQGVPRSLAFLLSGRNTGLGAAWMTQLQGAAANDWTGTLCGSLGPNPQQNDMAFGKRLSSCRSEALGWVQGCRRHAD